MRKANLFVFICDHGKTCNFIADCPECAKAQINSLRTRVAELESWMGEPVAWMEFEPAGDAYFLAYSYNPKAKTYPLFRTPPTVAAAIRKAAEVCRKTRDALEENRKVWEENPHLTPDESYIYEWEQSACRGEEYANDILAIPHDDSALREICMMVAEEAFGDARRYKTVINLSEVVDRVLGAKK